MPFARLHVLSVSFLNILSLCALVSWEKKQDRDLTFLSLTICSMVVSSAHFHAQHDVIDTNVLCALLVGCSWLFCFAPTIDPT